MSSPNSIVEDTTLLVFANGAGQQPIEIERRKGKGSTDRWSITPVNEQTLAQYIIGWNPSVPRPKLDHQGISSRSGNWTKLVRVIVN
jgi:hypothetical protein